MVRCGEGGLVRGGVEANNEYVHRCGHAIEPMLWLKWLFLICCITM